MEDNKELYFTGKIKSINELKTNIKMDNVNYFVPQLTDNRCN